AIWMLAGMLLLAFLGDVARVSSGAGVLLAHFLGAATPHLGWLGLAAGFLTLATSAFVFVRFASGRLAGNRATERTSRAHGAGIVVAAVLGVVLATRIVAWAGPVALARQLGPTELGAVFVVQSWGQSVGGVAFLVLATVYLARLAWGGGMRAPGATRVILGWGLCLFAAGLPMRGEASETRLARRAPAQESRGFEGALQSWREGKKDEALQRFMAVDFASRPLFPKGSPLGYSESEFVALPRAVNEKLHPKVLEEVQVMKPLALHVRDAAAAATRSGDRAQATRYLGQLRKCGQALQGPDSLALLQAVGKAFVKIADAAESAPARSPAR
ncbi:MAG: hypothetical protein JNL97_04900, partial [Verrucomicrobiales bacterium]|nr:hypothetical protein [Verrucomicrobiales bacterium]